MKLGLVIDLDTCVGCHVCAVACKEWNDAAQPGGLSLDPEPHPSGVWFNRVRNYTIEIYPAARTLSLPMSCMHCEDAACVTVCPTGASYKRADGIVLVDPERCMGCSYCAWACPYGARELDPVAGVMRKCTLCVDRIHDPDLPELERQPVCVLDCPVEARVFGDLEDPGSKVSLKVRERGSIGILPELGYEPVNRYLLPRKLPASPVQAEPAPREGLLGRLRSLTSSLLGR